MAQVRETRRFRVSPVELAIFTTIVFIFVNSLINLFYDWDEIHAYVAGGQPHLAGAERGIASTAPLFSSIELTCEDPKTVPKKKSGKKDLPDEPQEKTDAPKVSITGPLCGLSKNFKLERTEVINRTTNKTATVITDPTKGMFSTDFIQLNAGRNQISVRFIYKDGKELSRQLIVLRK